MAVNTGEVRIEAPPVLMPPRSLTPVARAAMPVFAATAGLMVGLAIGGVRSESSKWIDAERDRLAQESASLARWKTDLDALQRDWEAIRVKSDQLTQELAIARCERDSARERETKLREELPGAIEAGHKVQRERDRTAQRIEDAKKGPWKKLCDWKMKRPGLQSQSTESFLTNDEMLRVSWRAGAGDYVTINVVDSASNNVVGVATGPGNGSSLVQSRPGNYHLEIVTAGTATAMGTVEEPN